MALASMRSDWMRSPHLFSESGQYCGTIGDGCGGTLECGACPGDWVCENAMCVGGPSCVPIASCETGTTKFCGTVGDGCGRSIECGGCDAGETCTGGVCVTDDCTPLTCGFVGGQFCGRIGDGCGGALECGECPAGEVCGNANIDNLCVDPNCVPTGCVADNGGVYCGTIGDGCGGTVECDETCPNGEICGGSPWELRAATTPTRASRSPRDAKKTR